MKKNNTTIAKLLLSATFLTACGGSGGSGDTSSNTPIGETPIPKELVVPFFSNSLTADTKNLFTATVDDLNKFGEGKVFQNTDSFKEGAATLAHGVFQDMRKRFKVKNEDNPLEDIDELDEVLDAVGMNPNMDVKAAFMKIPNSAFMISEEAKKEDKNLQYNAFNTFQVKGGIARLDLAVDLKDLVSMKGDPEIIEREESAPIIRRAPVIRESSSGVYSPMSYPEFTPSHTFRLTLDETGLRNTIESTISAFPTLTLDKTLDNVFEQAVGAMVSNLNTAILPQATFGEASLSKLFTIAFEKDEDGDLRPNITFKKTTLKDIDGKPFDLTPENGEQFMGLSMSKLGEDTEKYVKVIFPQVIKNLPEELQFLFANREDVQEQLFSGEELEKFQEKREAWQAETRKRMDAREASSIEKLIKAKLAGNPFDDLDEQQTKALTAIRRGLGHMSDLSKLSKESKLKLYYYFGSDRSFMVGEIISKFKFDEGAEATFIQEYEQWEKQMYAARQMATPLFSSSTNLSSTRSARLGTTTGEIDLRQTSLKDKTALNLPLFVKLNGNISNLNSGESVEGSALVKLGNALFGINKTSTTNGIDFDNGSTHQETSMVSTFMFGKAFTELNAGIVDAQNVKKANWSGFKQVATVGYDFDSGFTPFVQAYGRQLSKNEERNQKEIGAFAGISYDISNEYANFFNHSTLFTLKTGAISSSAVTANNLRVESSLDINHGVNFQNGLSFDTNMQLSSSSNTLVKMSIGFSQ